MRRILSILLENESGALSRVVGLFSQRGYNIESLTVAPTDDPTLSRITIQTMGDEQVIEQIEKQLHKLVDVLKVNQLTQNALVEREIMLIKLQAEGENNRSEILRYTQIFAGKIVDSSLHHFTLEIIGDSAKLDSFVDQMQHLNLVIEVVRSGVIGMTRG